MRHATAAHVIGAAGLLCLTTACSSNTSTAPNAAPTQADAQYVAQGMQTAIQSSLSSFLGGVSPVLPRADRIGPSLVGFARLPQALLHGTAGAPMRFGIDRNTNSVPSCVVLSPAQPVDSDNDGIPDTATLTAAPHCTQQIDSVTTLAISGSIAEGDPTPTTPDANYTESVSNLHLALTTTGASATIGMNGTANVSQAPGVLTLDNLLTLAIATTQNNQTFSATYANNWTAVFQYSGTSLVGSSTLPGGTLSVTGSTAYTSASKAFSLAITTPTPLTVDPTCNAASPVTGGVLKGVFSGSNGSAYLTITWSGCQAPVVQFVGQSH